MRRTVSALFAVAAVLSAACVAQGMGPAPSAREQATRRVVEFCRQVGWKTDGEVEVKQSYNLGPDSREVIIRGQDGSVDADVNIRTGAVTHGSYKGENRRGKVIGKRDADPMGHCSHQNA